jgi:hypothetical protein
MGAVPLTKAFGRSIGRDMGTFEGWPSVFPAGAGTAATTDSDGEAAISAAGAASVVVVVAVASSVVVDLSPKALLEP